MTCLLLCFNNARADLFLDWVSFITREHPAVIGENQVTSDFGLSLSSAENVLYIGAPDYAHESDNRSGAVHKLVGKPSAPFAQHPHNKLIHQGHIKDDSPTTGDDFGWAITAAKTKGGDEAQLVIGVPRKDIGNFGMTAGLVHYIQTICNDCIDTELTSTSFHQDTPGIVGGVEAGDLFGYVLATGDFNNDGYDDIAVGVLNENIGDIENAGAVQIIMSNGPEGLTANNNQFWSKNSSSVIGDPEVFDQFGAALAVGDFDGDGVDDLAIGARNDDVDGVISAGSVHVLYGVEESVSGAHDNGLNAAGNQFWHQNSAGIAGGAEFNDDFGSELAVGDFNNDGVDDLAVGVGSEDIGEVPNAGAVNVIYGSMGAGLTAAGDLLISQDVAGFVGASEESDFFGGTLAVGDFNADGVDDLAIGAIGEDINEVEDTGAVYVVHGSNSGLQFSDEYVITEGVLGGNNGLRRDANFGFVMTVSDFDGDGLDDLAISTRPISDKASVTVIYQQDNNVIFVDGFEG